MFSAVILAGGAGLRMHQPVPKQFLQLAGKPMILHTLERLVEIEQISEIIIVCHSGYKSLMREIVENYMLTKPIVIIDGGDTRQESAWFGVRAAKSENIILHEAARPFVTANEFVALIEDDDPVVTYGSDIAFTVSVRSGTQISGVLNRESLVNIQLPQKLQRSPLLTAFEKASEEGKMFTEETSLLYYYFHEKIKIVPGTPYNVKITNSMDLITAETIYRDYILGGELQ